MTSDSGLDPVAVKDIVGITGKPEKVSEDWMAVMYQCSFPKVNS